MLCCFGKCSRDESASGKENPVSRHGSSIKLAGGGSVLPGCDPLRLLGEGTFGTVMLVRERSTSALFAAKIMSKAQLLRENQFENIITERRVLRDTGAHPFVIECHSGFQTTDAVVLVLEYLSGGDMYDLLKMNGCLDEDQARFYLAEILVGLGELHRFNFVFRDLKLENILIDSGGHIRLTDFGLTATVKTGAWDDRTITDMSGTAAYLAPEILAKLATSQVSTPKSRAKSSISLAILALLLFQIPRVTLSLACSSEIHRRGSAPRTTTK
jgi:serine/threonine protein kinase